MSDFDICNSTPEANKKTAGEIPYAQMQPGQSVFVRDNVRQDSLRSVVSHGSKKHNKLFKVIHLKDKGYYEVACIDDLSFTSKAAYLITTSSDEAKSKFGTDLGGSKRYPFDELSEGFSFAVPFAEGNEPSMRVQCSTWGKRLGKKIILLRHENIKMFEIACIPVKPIDFLPNSEEAKAKANAVQTEVIPSAYEAPVAPEPVKPMFFTESEPETEGFYNED